MILWVFHCLAVTISVSIVVGIEKNCECDTPLLAWNVTLMGAELFSLVLSLWTALIIKCYNYDPEQDFDADPNANVAARHAFGLLLWSSPRDLNLTSISHS